MVSSVGCDNRTQDIDTQGNEELLNAERQGRPGRVHRTDSTAPRELH